MLPLVLHQLPGVTEEIFRLQRKKSFDAENNPNDKREKVELVWKWEDSNNFFAFEMQLIHKTNEILQNLGFSIIVGYFFDSVLDLAELQLRKIPFAYFFPNRFHGVSIFVFFIFHFVKA